MLEAGAGKSSGKDMAYLLFVALVSLSIYVFILRNKLGLSIGNFRELEKRFSAYKESIEKQISNQKNALERLVKYQHIVNIEDEANRIKAEALKLKSSIQAEYQSKLSEATSLSQLEIDKARKKAEKIQEQAEAELAESKIFSKSEISKVRDKAKEIYAKAEDKLSEAHELAYEIEKTAKIRAEEIAGSALDAKENAEQFEAVEKAMRNLIKGYGDEYLSPNRPIIENLMEEYDFKEAGQKLSQTKTLIKSLLTNNQAADCSYVEDYRRRTAIEFVLDAFNGKVDSIMSQVKPHNHDKLEEQIIDVYNIVNHNGKAFRDAHISKAYLDATLEQLKWATIAQKIKQEDREEQRRIKEQIREEERAKREYEKARKDAEKEERLIQQAMKDAESKLLSAAEEERSKYEAEIAQLRSNLEEAYTKGERAMSMAQQTKQGHVYIISNIGSFGEEVFKVGLTRRLEPMDRVKELGDASVPFGFDVHAMVFSSDAPALEKKLHELLEKNRVNKINPRKEFFRVPVTSIKAIVEESGYSVHWTLKAEAAEYRETLRLEKYGQTTEVV